MTPILLFGALYGMGGLWPLRACLLEFASGGYVMVNSPSRQSNPVGSIRPEADSSTKVPKGGFGFFRPRSHPFTSLTQK